MPLASMSKVTSIFGMPRGAGGRPSSWKRPRVRLSRANLPLALEDVDLDARLVIRGRGEDLGLLGRDGRVPRDHLGEDAAQRFDAQREGRHVEQQDVLDVARQDRALDGRADGDDLVGIDAAMRLLAEELLDELLDARHPRLAADQDDLVDVRGLQVRRP